MARPRPRKTARKTADPLRPCPCGLGPLYGECCGRLHQREADAPTAEALMRSRYSAFVVHDATYLLRTWHPSTRPRTVLLDHQHRFTRLDILERTGGSFFDIEATVLFEAHYVNGDRPGVMREHSLFVREAGHWFYVAPVERSR